ncbi:serine hydrolase domain-containing protein [Fictibacillus aquaticus]|nr:serine hydrolase domain-containing protein [Fictibacillus aquaticus]
MSHLIDNIQNIIEDSMKTNNIPGTAVAVIKDNELILSQGFGMTNTEGWGSPVSANTLFRIASVSKLFTGTVIMMLVEQGLIDLDQPVQHYVPWFTTADTELSKLITIRMLLSHSSGLPTGGDGITTDLEGYMKETVPTVHIHFHPGTAYSYGNHSLNIAGYVAEHVTQKPFAALMEELLFKPLQMNQTTYDPLKAMTYPLALPHGPANDGEHRAIEHQMYNNKACYPSYYAFSSIEDLSKFAMLHLQDGMYDGKQLLSEESVAEMRTQQSKWYTPTDGGCGITFFQENKDGIDRFWHYGQYSHEYSSQFILVPEKGIAVIALANGENIFQAGYEIVDELLKGETVESARQDSSDDGSTPDWALYEGSYLHSYYGIIHLEKREGEVFLKHNDQEFKLVRHSSDTYFAHDAEGHTPFTVGLPAQIPGQSSKTIMVNSKGCPEFLPTYKPEPSDWEEWTGVYGSGKESYEISIDGEALILKEVHNNKEQTCRPITKNLFMTQEYGVINFTDVNGTITLEFVFAWRYPKQQASELSLLSSN